MRCIDARQQSASSSGLHRTNQRRTDDERRPPAARGDPRTVPTCIALATYGAMASPFIAGQRGVVLRQGRWTGWGHGRWRPGQRRTRPHLRPLMGFSCSVLRARASRSGGWDQWITSIKSPARPPDAWERAWPGAWSLSLTRARLSSRVQLHASQGRPYVPRPVCRCRPSLCRSCRDTPAAANTTSAMANLAMHACASRCPVRPLHGSYYSRRSPRPGSVRPPARPRSVVVVVACCSPRAMHVMWSFTRI